MIHEFTNPVLCPDAPYAIFDADGVACPHKYVTWLDSETGRGLAYEDPLKRVGFNELKVLEFRLSPPARVVGASEEVAPVIIQGSR